MANIVHSGWLTKSPPENKMRSHFRIFRSQWKKRYFVLRKPSGSLPDQYELHYYKDQRCQNKKGSIDLEQCEQIIEALDSDLFPFLLAIKTSYRNKVRMYYLATDSENDMNAWVQCLCQVCGLRLEDLPTDIPEPKPGTATTQPVGAGAGQTVANGFSQSPQQNVRKAGTPLVTHPRARDGQQTSLHGMVPTAPSSIRTPTSARRKSSVESTLDEEAPPLPQKRNIVPSNMMITGEDDVFVPSLYDHPPVLPAGEAAMSRKSSYPYKFTPAIASQGTQRLSVDEPGCVTACEDGSSHTSLSIPADSDSNICQTTTSKDSYQHHSLHHHDSVTSSDSDIPPRPPKPCHLQSPYQNLLPPVKTNPATDLTSNVPAPTICEHSRRVPGYDVPRQTSQTSSQPHYDMELSHITAAPLKSGHHTFSSHTYLNTNSPGSLLPPRPGDSQANTETVSSQPLVPPPRQGVSAESRNDRLANSLYQFPPHSTTVSHTSSGNPSNPHAPPSVSPRTQNGHIHPSSSHAQGESASSIFSTKRTRSFKSPHSLKGNITKHSPRTKTISLSATVPVPRPLLPPRPREMSTSEDEDLRSCDQEEETHHPLSLLRSVPAPALEAERELKYIDLEMPESCQELPRSSHSHGHSHGHAHGHSHGHAHAERGKEGATEYREIDFVKTQALSDTKRVKEKERQHDEQS